MSGPTIQSYFYTLLNYYIELYRTLLRCNESRVELWRSGWRGSPKTGNVTGSNKLNDSGHLLLIFVTIIFLFLIFVTIIFFLFSSLSPLYPSTLVNQCPARVDIGSSRSEKWNENLVHSFREVKSEMKISFTHFENEKWNENALRSRSRMKSEMKIP